MMMRPISEFISRICGFSSDSRKAHLASQFRLKVEPLESRKMLSSVASQPLEIVVEQGDTLSAIAKEHGTTMDSIVEANGIENPDLIFVGQEIKIPGQIGESTSNESMRNVSTQSEERQSVEQTTSLIEISSVQSVSTNQTDVVVQSGDTLSAIAKAYDTTVESIVAANGIGDQDSISIGQEIEIPAQVSQSSSNELQDSDENRSLSGILNAGLLFSPKDDASDEINDGGSNEGSGESGSDGGGDDGEGGNTGDDSDLLHFNDVVGSQSGISGHDNAPGLLDEARARGLDSSTSDDWADYNYQYNGVDGEGAHAFGIGVLDFERPAEMPDDEWGWIEGYEVVTLDSRVGSTDEFRGLEFDANGFTNDYEFLGQQVNWGAWNATGNLRWDDNSKGGSLALSAFDVNYANGAPSPDSDNDFGVTGGVSFGLDLGGFNILTGDPDGDGHKNYGFEASYLVGSVGLTSESVDEVAADAVNGTNDWLKNLTNDLGQATTQAASFLGRVF